MPSNAPIILHIVYIHGFQGDHTTFQAFPTDLHIALQPTLPPHIELRSILYPTYKSKHPIAIATEKFLQWLETLPAGPVILCGHSMGGLLAAEAATSPINTASKRVIALLACDVPFLGMHPHVVVSGIASLLPNQKRGKLGQGGGVNGSTSGLKTETEMNDARHVDIPSNAQIRSPSPNTSYTSSPAGQMESSTSSGRSLTPPPLPPRPSSSPQMQTQAQSKDPQLSSLPHQPAFISRTIDFIQSHADDRVVKFISKHRSEPIAAAKRWVVESFEFGICMFDPKGLRDRYAALERWQGDWVAFWTETVPRNSDGREMPVMPTGDEDDQEASRKEHEATASLGRLLNVSSTTDSVLSSPSFSRSLPSLSSLEVAVDAPVSGPVTKSESTAIEKQLKVDQKQRDKELKSQAKTSRGRREAEIKAMRKQNTHSPHHFVVRPFREPSGLTHRWERVKIHGAKDEVEAHCGLFLKDINVDYDGFLRRVAEVTQGWVVKLSA